ncbi:MAG: nucleotidyltransferase domain-containing protein [Campylobacterales bacterium]
MIDIEKLKPLIVERLKPLNPDKIILFGSYAYGEPNEESDIDIFILKDGLDRYNIRAFELEASKRLLDIEKKYRTNGIDVLSAPTKEVYKKEDYFYKVELLQKGKVWYEQNISERVA